jgi:hypothetical protein
METMNITVFGDDIVKSGRYLLPPNQVKDGDSWFVSRYTALYIQGVHCAGLLDVQNILSADSGISIHSVIT